MGASHDQRKTTDWARQLELSYVLIADANAARHRRA